MYSRLKACASVICCWFPRPEVSTPVHRWHWLAAPGRSRPCHHGEMHGVAEAMLRRGPRRGASTACLHSTAPGSAHGAVCGRAQPLASPLPRTGPRPCLHRADGACCCMRAPAMYWRHAPLLGMQAVCNLHAGMVCMYYTLPRQPAQCLHNLKRKHASYASCIKRWVAPVLTTKHVT